MTWSLQAPSVFLTQTLHSWKNNVSSGVWSVCLLQCTFIDHIFNQALREADSSQWEEEGLPGGRGATWGTYAAAQWCAGFSSASPPHSSGSGYAASCSPVSLSPWIHLSGREEPKLVGPTSPGGFWRENKIPCQQIVSTAMKEPRWARQLLPDPNTNDCISHLGH